MDGDNVIYPDSINIDPNLAKDLFNEHCAFLVLEGLPIGSEFGIDFNSYNTGPNFKGIKLIPPGIHCVYVSPKCNKDEQIGPRTSFFHEFKKKELLLKKWSEKDEDFDTSYETNQSVYKTQVDSYKSNIYDLDKYLGTYDFSTYKNYQKLTNKFSPQLVESLIPESRIIRSVQYSIPKLNDENEVDCEKEIINSKKNPGTNHLTPHLKVDKFNAINYTKIDNTYKKDFASSNPSYVTNYHLDSTLKFESCFNSSIEGWNRYFCELQFSFLAFLLCQVYESFEHWKALVELVCKADKLINSSNAKYFEEFLDLIEDELNEIPQDLFHDIVDDNNLLASLLTILFDNIETTQFNDNACVERLKQKSQKLKCKLVDKFGWIFEPPDDEEPAIVEE